MKNPAFQVILWSIFLSACGSDTSVSECERFDVLAIEMDQTLDEILEQYRADFLFIRRIRASQVDWINYRNSHILSLYTGNEDSYGDNYAECRCRELNKMAEARIEQLSHWLNDNSDLECVDSSHSPSRQP